jgi:putative FmdB family regulatory protein
VPLYEYQCPRCGRFERIQKFADPPLTECPTCGQPVQKLLSAPAIQFKGTGWYITDYARKSSGKAEGSTSTGKDGGKDGGKDSGSSSKEGSSTSTSTTTASKDSSGGGSSTK